MRDRSKPRMSPSPISAACRRQMKGRVAGEECANVCDTCHFVTSMATVALIRIARCAAAGGGIASEARRAPVCEERLTCGRPRHVKSAVLKVPPGGSQWAWVHVPLARPVVGLRCIVKLGQGGDEPLCVARMELECTACQVSAQGTLRNMGEHLQAYRPRAGVGREVVPSCRLSERLRALVAIATARGATRVLDREHLHTWLHCDKAGLETFPRLVAMLQRQRTAHRWHV